MPLAPFWTSLMINDGNNQITKLINLLKLVIKFKMITKSYTFRDTNAHAENWFRIVKHQILKRQTHLLIDDFVLKVYDSLRGRYFLLNC